MRTSLESANLVLLIKGSKVRQAALLLLLSVNAMADSPVLARGRLLETDSGLSGEICIRTLKNQVYWYVYDGKTYVEREKQRTTVARLLKGEELEIVSDTGPDAGLRYARTIHVMTVEPQGLSRAPLSLGRYAAPRRPPVTTSPLRQDLIPRGVLTFAGLVARLNDERFILRTRADGEKTIYLRPDTRYLESGTIVNVSSLQPNRRVFVRASKNLDGELEAFQVVWGELLAPDAK